MHMTIVARGGVIQRTGLVHHVGSHVKVEAVLSTTEDVMGLTTVKMVPMKESAVSKKSVVV